MSMVILYELKLMAYFDLRMETWIIIVFAFVALWLGSVTVILARETQYYGPDKSFANDSNPMLLFADEGKTLKKVIIIFTLIGSISAFYHWWVLIKEFGSITAVIIQAAIIYQMRVQGEISTGIPYIFALVHVALVLSGIYTAYRRKFDVIILFPFIILILKSIADMARAGMLLGFLEYFIAFFIFRQFLKMAFKKDQNPNKKKVVLGVIFLIALIIAGASIVKLFRTPMEKYMASSSSLRKLESGLIISPTVYLYSSSHIGILNSYLIDQDENNYFGEVTFFPFYRFISKLGVIEEPNYYQKGYFIPMWTNTGTYLRDLHSDFGYAGVFVIPFLIGLLSTIFGYRYYSNGNFRDLIILIYMYIIVAYSFLSFATRLGNWLIGLVVLLLFIPYIERVAQKNKKLIN
jgi:oligosaccharide repeat unit polymerase